MEKNEVHVNLFVRHALLLFIDLVDLFVRITIILIKNVR